MRTISLFINVTLDGYFEGPNHDLSFFKGDDEDNSFFREQSGSGATLLMGHRTYEMMKSFWPTPQAQKSNPEVAKYMNEMPKIVAAHRPFDPGWTNAAVISGDVVGEVRKLKKQPGKPIVILGSNTLAVSLLPEGLIDEVQMMVNPVALGNGTPLFKGLTQRVDLKLLKTRQFKSGNALLTYAP
jgi:dihydrofolate reductase